MIRAVIVGCAHMHVNEIALYIHEQPQTVLCGIADVPPVIPELSDKRYTRGWNLHNIVSLYGIPSFDDYTDMIVRTKPDVAYLLCENFRKADIAERIAALGVDIVIEKPMAVTKSDALRICALKSRYNVNIYVNWPVIWRRYIREMKSALDAEICGGLQKLRYINGHTGPLGKGAKHRGVSAATDEMTTDELKSTWWYHKEYGGGAYADILCYGCYFSRWFFGALPEEIVSLGKNLNTGFGNVEDNVVAVMNYGDKFAVAEGSWTTPRRRMPTGPEAVCSDGAVFCEGKADGASFVSAVDLYGNDISVPELPEADCYRNMPWHYYAVRELQMPPDETLTVAFNTDIAIMLEAAEESNRVCRFVKVPAI